MGEQRKAGSAAGPQVEGSAAGGGGEVEAPVTPGQKIFIAVLYLYVLSLVWLVLSHHWYGVLPQWLDPH